MEEFKKKIQRRRDLCMMFCGAASAIYFLLQRLIKNAPDFSRGMIAGVLVGMDVVAVFLLIKYMIVLRSEEKLKEEYIKSTDERNIAISKETMRTASVVSLMLTAIAVIVSGFFSEVVATTLFAEMTASTLITVLVNIFYKKKM